MGYLGVTVSGLLTTLFIIFVIVALGFLIGGIKIKGISLGTAGVLLVAILVGVLFSYVDSFEIGGKTIVLWSKTAETVGATSVESVFSTISNLGTVLFVTAVGLIAGPKFFRSFNKSMISYVVMGAVIVLVGVGITIGISWIDKDMDIAMGTGLLSGSLTSTPAFGAADEAAGALSSEVTAGYGIGYLYGVLGVVLFVQLMPKILKVDIAMDRET